MAQHHFVGKAGHLAVMAELAWRGYNVATPEIDVGDDVFAVDNDSGAMRRIQVKTSSPRKQVRSTRYQFSVRENAITSPMTPDLWFIFVLRSPSAEEMTSRWRFVLIPRQVLNDWTRRLGFGSLNSTNRQIRLTLHDDGRLVSSGQDISSYLEDWSNWPALEN